MPFAKLHCRSATRQRIVQDFRRSAGRGLLQSNRHPDSPFSAVAGAAIGNERVVPELSGTKMVAAIERSTGQNRTADTVAQRKVDKATGRFEVAHFSKSGSVRVVDEPAGEWDVTAEFFGRNIPQTQGMRVNQCLPLFIQNTGQRNADAQDFSTGQPSFQSAPARFRQAFPHRCPTAHKDAFYAHSGEGYRTDRPELLRHDSG